MSAREQQVPEDAAVLDPLFECDVPCSGGLQEDAPYASPRLKCDQDH